MSQERLGSGNKEQSSYNPKKSNPYLDECAAAP